MPKLEEVYVGENMFYRGAPQEEQKLHLEVAHHILKYMTGTQDYRVFFIKNGIQTHWRGS